jgi:hypothetical protein
VFAPVVITAEAPRPKKEAAAATPPPRPPSRTTVAVTERANGGGWDAEVQGFRETFGSHAEAVEWVKMML